jgi:HAMP domain-containing protein
MAASNDSQGLKIAVAVFIALAVILAVTSYFLYSNGAAAEARLATATDKLQNADKAQRIQQTQIEELRNRIGVRTEEADAIKNEIEAHYKKVNERLDALGNAVNTTLQKAQAAGAQQQELQDLQDRMRQAIQSFRGEKNLNYISSLDRLTELMENLALLTTQIGVNYVDVRKALESATNVAKTQVDVQTKAAEAAVADVMDEHKKHNEERQSLLGKVESLTKDNDVKTTEIANLQASINRMKDDYEKERGLLTTQIREWRDRAERSDTILDHPDGYITFVDYEAREVQVNINRSMGARPQMVMSVFDSHSPGVPTERPKGSIMLTKVGDRFSVARIVGTKNPIDPIRTGDIVYSPAWSPNSPTRFALVGKIDVNRDGRDDREELKRMIQGAGGIVEFDLPPPWVGRETGKLSPKIDWYVTDDRIPLRDVFTMSHSEPVMKMQGELNQRMGEVQKEARLEGIRPMPIGRLLNFLGYDINTPVIGGRSEAVNSGAMRRLTAPRPQATPGATTKPATGAATAPSPAPAEEKNADDNADETPKKKESTAKKKAADEESGDQ